MPVSRGKSDSESYPETLDTATVSGVPCDPSRAPPCRPAASPGRDRRPVAHFGRPRWPAAAAPAAGWARGARRGRMYRRAWCRRVDPAVACTWRHAGPARCARRAPGRPFFGLLGWRKKGLSKKYGRRRRRRRRSCTAVGGIESHGPERDFPWRAPPTSSAGAAAGAAVLSGAPPRVASDVFGPPRGAP